MGERTNRGVRTSRDLSGCIGTSRDGMSLGVLDVSGYIDTSNDQPVPENGL